MAAQSVVAAHTPSADPTPRTALVRAGKQLADGIKAEFGIDASFQHADVIKQSDIQAMIETIFEEWELLDYAANVAGIRKDGGDMKEDQSRVPRVLVDKHV
ncbi:hypothetical protein DOTSEDRAFT_26756 [Dothistroma septosporum NZE10]|uniref:Uncharacterized protein n=1 Tax=Dothistroma septosporum (strain NZE10 / CBS 128990) TaxID=675120 RepID=N1PHJ4_DOTSN|nr:hypothetical protein DOTSEDRAFT_26756 [Dothistroma septosporum NZE10]